MLVIHCHWQDAAWQGKGDRVMGGGGARPEPKHVQPAPSRHSNPQTQVLAFTPEAVGPWVQTGTWTGRENFYRVGGGKTRTPRAK